MKRTMVVGVALALLILTGLAVAEDKAHPTGIWKWKFPNQSAENRLRFRLEGDKLTGALLRRTGEVPIEEATYKDGFLSFKITVISEQGDGLKIPCKYTGTVSGDTIKGTIEFKHPGQTISKDWDAKRVDK
jgi:hypothetical protein